MTKLCPNCGLDKPLECFALRKRSPSGRKSWCRGCECAGQKERNRRRMAVGLCVVCGRGRAAGGTVLCAACSAKRCRQLCGTGRRLAVDHDHQTGRRLAVDHDHQTGRIRGLLCFRCNTSLARYEEYGPRFAEYLSSAKISG